MNDAEPTFPFVRRRGARPFARRPGARDEKVAAARRPDVKPTTPRSRPGELPEAPSSGLLGATGATGVSGVSAATAAPGARRWRAPLRPGALARPLARLALDQRSSLRVRLLLLLLPFILPLVGLLVLSIAREAIEERAQAGQRMMLEARLAAARLDDRVSDVRQLLTVLAGFVEPNTSTSAAIDLRLKRFERELPPNVERIVVWDASGEAVGLISPGHLPPPADAVDRTIFHRATPGVGVGGESPLFVAIDRDAEVALMMPIMRGGRRIGSVSALLRPTEFQDLLAPERRLPEAALVSVMDEARNIVFRSVRIDPGELPPGAAAAIGPPVEGPRDGPDRSGTERIGGLAKMHNLPWTVYVGIPTSAALGPVHWRIAGYLALGGALLVLAVVGGFRVARHIAAPLAQLADDAATFEGGGWTHRSTVRQGGEIGRLAGSLNRMADALEQRTESLAASEAKLREITDNLPVLIAYLDADWRIRFANRPFRQWTGRKYRELIGAPLEEFYPAELLDPLRPRIEAALAGHRTVFEHEISRPPEIHRLEITLVPDKTRGPDPQGLFVLMQDVTENRRAGEAQAQSERRLSLALEAAGTALIDWAVPAGKLFLSAEAAALRGEPRVAEGRFAVATVRRWLHPDDRASVDAALEATLSGASERADIELRVSTFGGDWIWLRVRGRVVERDADGGPLRFAGTGSDITQRKLAEQRLQHLANFDALTGLPNRALFHDRLSQAIARQGRAGTATTTALLYLDIDHFKTVNDTLGHGAGDRLLIEFAAMLSATVRSADTVARLGGDEFTVILEELPRPGDAQRIAQTLVERARRTVGRGSRSVRVTTTVGITFLTLADTDPSEPLRRADAALYDAKRAGRDGIAVATGNAPDTLPDRSLTA